MLHVLKFARPCHGDQARKVGNCRGGERSGKEKPDRREEARREGGRERRREEGKWGVL